MKMEDIMSIHCDVTVSGYKIILVESSEAQYAILFFWSYGNFYKIDSKYCF